MRLASLFHWILGRRELLQFYANITHSTQEECLEYHGKIYKSEEEVPSEELDCTFHLLEFPVWELSDYREKERRMKKKAQDELERRGLFRGAKNALSESREDEAKRLFEESGEIDIFLAELEDFYEDFGEDLSEDIREDLKEIFVHAYKEKFAKERYERLPSLMRIEREEEGVERIKEMFSAPGK